MPIGVLSRRRTLSPLEEELLVRQSDGAMAAGNCALDEGGRGGGVRAEEEEVLVSIGTTILATRPCQPKASCGRDRGWEGRGTRGHVEEKKREDHQLLHQDSEKFDTVCVETLPEMQGRMKHLWRQGVPVCIEVKGQFVSRDGARESSQSVLLEQWLVQVISKRPQSTHTSPSLLLQAVHSFLHFSQIRSWIISQGGSLSFELLYRVCAPGDDTGKQFTVCPPTTHSFPPATLTPHSILQICTTFLPRLKQIPPSLLKLGTPQPTLAIPFPPRVKATHLPCVTSHGSLGDSTGLSERPETRAEACLRTTGPNASLCGSRSCEQLNSSGKIYKQTGHTSATPPKGRQVSSCSSVPTLGSGARSCSSVPAMGCTTSFSPCSSDLLDRLNNRVASLSVSASPHSNGSACSVPSHSPGVAHYKGYPGSASHLSQRPFLPGSQTRSPDTGAPRGATGQRGASESPTVESGFPFSPPQPSPLSPKLLSGLGDQHPFNSLLSAMRNGEHRDHQQDRRERTHRTLAQAGSLLDALRKQSQGNGANEADGCGKEHTCDYHFCFERPCVKQSGGEGGQSTAPLKGAGLAAARKELLPSDSEARKKESCPPSWGQVRPPSASSPVPFSMRRSGFESNPSEALRRRSCAISIKSHPPRPPQRSNSAPAAALPSLYLLGTFEESVLNGRLEPCGFVDGFTAALGASGSFCPQHITLPVTATFFSLSESRGTSPYLGHVDLSHVGRRGYHIPKKGTVQVTLFNPNKTVVKIFIITYDLSDMPPKSQTFLRQRTLSRFSHNLSTGVASLPALHYLIHLRFLCSKSGRVYLHTDIRLIFARRAPDTDPDASKVTLFTVMEGPSNPKYGPLDQLKKS